MIALALAGPIASCRGPAWVEGGREPIRWRTIGRSVQGRALEAATLGSGPWRVYWIGGIHGDEPEGGRELDTLLEILAEPAVAARYTVRVLRDANPDGTLSGTRGNAAGVDLNRNLPATNFASSARSGPAPLSEPETLALWTDLEAFGPQLVVVSHSARTGPFVNFDGPARAWAERFARGAGVADPRWRVMADMGYPTPGSLGSALGVERGIAILTLEFGRGDPAPVVREALGSGAAALLRAPPPEAAPGAPVP